MHTQIHGKEVSGHAVDPRVEGKECSFSRGKEGGDIGHWSLFGLYNSSSLDTNNILSAL